MSNGSELGFPDTVAVDGGAHNADATADNGDSKGEAPLRHMGPARKEYAGPGHAGKSETTTPIGPQTGFGVLGGEKAPHGGGEYTGDDAAYRRDWGNW